MTGAMITTSSGSKNMSTEFFSNAHHEVSQEKINKVVCTVGTAFSDKLCSDMERTKDREIYIYGLACES